jgi:nucleotide-binding universal stress UspA family protein
MNARGSTEVIVATIGLTMGVLSQNLFTMIVAMAVITTLAMPPSLRWALRRLPMREEEHKRLAREVFEERAFVAKLERILVAADDSPNGVFAARIAGIIAGSRGMLVTVVKVPDPGTPAVVDEEAATDRHDQVVEALKASAATAATEETKPVQVDVVVPKADASIDAVVEQEARKGYDLLVIGVEPAMSPKGGFHDAVAGIAGVFEGSIAVVVARGAHQQDPAGAPINALVPVTGNEASRRGAEVAAVLAKAAESELAVLSVLTAAAKNERERLGTARRDAAEVVKEIKAIAEFHEVAMNSAIRSDLSAEDAILRQARRGRNNLIVLGVSRRPGKRLSFGELATALLESSDRSLLFVAAVPQAPSRRAAAPPPANGDGA